MTSPDLHLAWCDRQCAAVLTGVHESRPVPVVAGGGELLGVTVAVERLITSSPVDLVVLEFVQGDRAEQYRLPLGQVRAFRDALRDAFDRLARS